MSIIDSLNKHKDEILYARFHDHGFSMRIKSKPPVTRSTLSGYDRLTDEALNLAIDRGIPTVVMPDSEPRVVSLPLIGDDMREGPINSMSYASFEVYANLACKLGGKMYNVRPLKFVSEMFKTNKYRLQIFEAFRSSDTQAMAKLLTTPEPPPIWTLGDDPALRSFKGFVDVLAREIEMHNQGDETMMAQYRAKTPAAPDGQDMDFFVLALGHQRAAKDLMHLSNIVTWNALSAQAGSFDERTAWEEISAYMTKEFSANRANKNRASSISQDFTDRLAHLVSRAIELSGTAEPENEQGMTT